LAQQGNFMGDGTDDGATREGPWLWAGLAAIAIASGVDLLLDRPAGLLSPHLLFELAVLAFSLTLLLRLTFRAARARRALAQLVGSLEARSAERDAWRARAESLLRGLGEEIDLQLGRWSLTPAERETTLLLLKGFGHKEIAALLGKSERTVRQQAAAAYRKSGLSGRAELSAFFLEDLLLPRAAADPPSAP
jgi:DNA-binding CsgD family transcriptional regulator